MATVRKGVGGPCGQAILKGYALTDDGNLSARCADWAAPEVIAEPWGTGASWAPYIQPPQSANAEIDIVGLVLKARAKLRRI
jgi:hypothetical protein